MMKKQERKDLEDKVSYLEHNNKVSKNRDRQYRMQQKVTDQKNEEKWERHKTAYQVNRLDKLK